MKHENKEMCGAGEKRGGGEGGTVKTKSGETMGSWGRRGWGVEVLRREGRWWVGLGR